MTFERIARAASVAALVLVSSCGGGGADEGGIGGTGSPMGTLRIGITDAPACGFDAVNITVDKVRVNQSATAGDADGGWVDIALAQPTRIDLLTLSNGVLMNLGQTPLPAGTYTQMRLVLAANGGATPLANSVVPTGGAEVALTTPSGQQSGLKANIDITVAANQLADFVIDFNACKSVVTAGNSGKYLLKPVIQVVPNLLSGVTGYVDLSVANGITVIALEQAGVVVKSTVPDATGKFVLAPVQPGTYDLVLTAPGRTTAVVTGVAVSTQVVTSLNAAATALTLPASPTAAFSGVVATGVSPIDASVSVEQLLGGVRPVVVGAVAADSVSGAYAYAAPANTPLVAAFTSGAAPIFAPDALAANHYTLVASSGGATKSATVDVAPGIGVVTNFTFP